MQYAFGEMQTAFDGLLKKYVVPVVGLLFRGRLAWWSRLNSMGNGPRDAEGHAVARAMQTPGAQRDRHTDGIFVPVEVEEALGRMENALRLVYEGDHVARTIGNAVKAKKLPKGRPEALVQQALDAGIVSAEEADLFRRAEAARNDAIQVDSFTLEEYMRGAVEAGSVPAGGDGAHGDGASLPAGA